MTIDVREFGARPNSGTDATSAFQRAIAAAKAKHRPVTISVPPGRYDFFPDAAVRRACYMSNATESGSDAIRTIAIDLSDTRDITLAGDSAQLVMRGSMTMVVAERAVNLKLSGLEFDFARPMVSEMRVVETRPGDWVAKVDSDSPFEIVENRIRWIGEGWRAFHDGAQHYDPVEGRVWRCPDPTAGMRIEKIAEGRLRFRGSVSPEVQIGHKFQFRAYPRSEAGMWFNRSQKVTLEKIAVRATSGFGLLFQFVDGIRIEKLEAGPRRDSERTAASAADILHFSGCRGEIWVQDSKLTASQDDAINVHGTHLRVVEALAEDRLKLCFGHPQTWGFTAFQRGDTIELVRSETLLPYFRAKIREVEMGSDRHEQTILLDRKLPRDIEPGSDVVENVTWNPRVTIDGCEVNRVPTRGFLITTRGPVIVRNNRFEDLSMPAILIENDAKGWFESGPVHGLTIIDNEFRDIRDVPIRINPQIGRFEKPVHSSITIEKNYFILRTPLAIRASGVDGLQIDSNEFLTSLAKPSGASLPEELLSTSECTGVHLGRNRIRILPNILER